MLSKPDYLEATRRYKNKQLNGHERQRYHALLLVTKGYGYRETADILFNAVKLNNGGLSLRPQQCSPNWLGVGRKSHHWPAIRARSISKERSHDAGTRSASNLSLPMEREAKPPI